VQVSCSFIESVRFRAVSLIALHNDLASRIASRCSALVWGAAFAEMCSGSEAGSYLRLIDFVYHSTLGLRVIKKKKEGAAFKIRASAFRFGYRGTSLIRNNPPPWDPPRTLGIVRL